MRQNAALCANGLKEPYFSNQHGLLVVLKFNSTLKVALQIFGRKFYKKNTKKKTSLYSQSLLIFILKTLVVESHPTTRKLDIYYGQGRHRRETQSFFTWAARSFTYEVPRTENTQAKLQTWRIASNVDMMENNFMVVMLENLSVISHCIFPQCFFFFISGAKSKNNLRCFYVAF